MNILHGIKGELKELKILLWKMLVRKKALTHSLDVFV